MKRSMFFRIGVCIFATLLTSSCNTSEARPEPSVEPYVPPLTEITLTNTPLPPLPDFPEEVLFFGYGGAGGGIECGEFTLSSIPSVIGGTTYPTTVTGHESYTGLGPSFFYPRRATLCLGGIPKDVTINIKLISPDKNVTLNLAIQIIDSKFINDKFWPTYLAVKWVEYPDDWVENNQNFWLRSFAAREGGDDSDTNAPIVASLGIWWPGLLQSGVWKVEVSWPGQFIYGDFHAETRYLPEISLGDPNFDTKLFPDMNSAPPYTCRPALYDQPFFAVAEAFPPNTPVYILVYQATNVGMDQETTLAYQTVIHSDEQGIGRATLSTTFSPGSLYYLFGVANPTTSVAVVTESHNSVFNFTAIANAMDCFFIPAQSSSSCPGAPPQRMILNQRGYACTRSDPVRVRVSPARSANTLVQIEPGTQFTVIGGPACSDNWSWWNVRLDDGTTGWLAEGGDEVDPYFICP